jgi:hypothetical protein
LLPRRSRLVVAAPLEPDSGRSAGDDVVTFELADIVDPLTRYRRIQLSGFYTVLDALVTEES